MDDIEDIYELSPMQQGILFHSLYEQGAGVYFHQLAWTLQGKLNIDAFKQAWHKIVARHAVLRTSFHWQELEKPLQVVHSTVELPWVDRSWRGLTPLELEEKRSAFLRADSQQGFHLDEAPLMRCALIELERDRYAFVWSLHHLLLDGWSMAIVLKEVFEFYEAIARGENLYLPPPTPFREYIVWLQQQDFSKAKAFWQQALQGFKMPTILPSIKRSKNQDGYTEQDFNLTEVTTTALQSLARSNSLTLNTILQGTWALLLSCYSGDSDVIFGVTVSGRPPSLPKVESMVGVSINTLPVRVQVPEKVELLPWLRTLQAQQVEQQQYSYMPLVEIQTLSEVSQGLPLFESIVIFQNYPVDTSTTQGDLKIGQIKGTGHTNYPLTVMVSPGPELSVRIKYDGDRFGSKTITLIRENLQGLLEAIATNQEQKIALFITKLRKKGKPLKLQQLEAALMSASEVEDCFVLEREKTIVAYVVRSSKLTVPEKLNSYLQSQLATYKQPDIYVQVSALPLTDTGEIDEAVLHCLPAIDGDLVQLWEKQLRELPEIEQVAVVVQSQTNTLPPLHLSDLLPQTEARAVDFTTVSGDSQLLPAPERQAPSAKSRADAISHGKPLQYPENMPRTLAELLQVTARTSNKNILYIQRDGSELFQSYGELLTQAQRINALLKELGLQPQDKVILQIKNPQDFIPAFWGCILGGFVPVPLAIAPTYSEVNNAVNKLHNAWQMLENPIILASKELVEAIASLSGILGLENFKVESCDRLYEYDPDPDYHLSQPDDLAILLLTSGSTGMPKGVMLSHWNILSSVAATSEVSQLTQEDISLNWLPLDHPGPLIRCCIRCVFIGGEQIHVPTDLILHQPLTWFDLLERYQVTNTWSPNFAFTLVNEQSAEIKQRTWNLSAVRSLLNTAEPIVPQTAQRFWELFQSHQLAAQAMHSSWGMAETSSGVTFSDKFLLETPTPTSFAELGLPIPGVSLRIVSGDNQVLEESTIGYLQVKGEQVTQGYYNNSQLDREVFTTDGWFATGDLGFIQAGRLTITGRQKDVIIINGANYYSHEIEAVVEKVPDIEVSYTAAVCVGRDKLAIFFSTSLADNDRLLRNKLEEIQQQVVTQIGIKPDYLLPVAKAAIPKTSIGKIQRSQLSQQLSAGEFNHILKKVDILLENAKTIPDWFYRQIWQTKQLRPSTDLSTVPTLIFIESLGLGDYIGEQLKQENQSCIKVSVGEVFVKISDDCYSINPEKAEDYYLLLESIAVKQKYIEQIIHLWNYSKYKGEISSLAELETAQNTGVYSLLFLVQALAKVQGERPPVKLLFISSHTQSTAANDEIAYEKSSVLGLLKTIPQEMPWLNCRHIDLSVDRLEVNGDSILAEIQDITGEREVAYRKGQRLVPRLERVNWSSEFKQALPFKTGGSYLITGGLGGISVEIAKYLLEHYHTKLILVGRTPLLAEKLAAFEQLQQLNGTVMYETVDISDRPGMEAIRSTWGELDGIIHLAGVARESLIESETQSGLAISLRSKVSGTWVLHQLIKDNPNSIFINFSSVNGFFGGTTVGAYAAANSFIDAFSDYQRTRSSLHSYCLAWSMWDETGMSQGYQMKELSRDRGYYPIQKQQGIYAFLAGMSLGPTRLTIGLDGSNVNIQRYQSKCYSWEKLIAYFTGTVPANLPQPPCDRFGTPTACQLALVKEMPLTDSGEIDLHKLAGKITPQKEGERVAPRNDVEREIAQIWQEVLGVENVGIYDNFFQLGGHSLRAIQVIYRLQNNFSVDLPLQNLFKTPNIAGLAATIGQQRQEQTFCCLVPIQQKGNRSPFFCVHPVGGNVLCYADLARNLGNEQPFYGLQSVGLDGEQEPMTYIEDMASHYIKAIQTIQPTGPYYIGGWSLGGAIAFEIAQQLSVAGQEIALLALIDSYTPKVIDQVSDQRKRVLSQKSSVRVLDDATLASYYFAQDLSSLLGKDLLISLDQLQELDLDAQLTYILEQARIAKVLPPELGLTQLRRLFQVFQANIQARLRYRPQPYTGLIVLFCASEQAEEVTADSSQGWDTLAIGGLEKHLIHGGHYHIVKSPNLAEKLKVYLS